MQRKIVRIWLAGIAALMASGLTALPCHAAPMQPAVNRDTVVFAIGKDIGNLDAQVAATGDSQRYALEVFDTLYGFDRNGNLVPHVAKSYRIGDDGLSYTFELRPDVLFQNGAKVTAADVKYSMERILDPATKSTHRPYFADLIDSMQTHGEYSITFKLKRRDGAFLNKIAGFLPLVPEAYVRSLANPAAFAQAPISCGPFKFVDQKIGQSVTLERFDQYYGAKPSIKRLIYQFIPDASSRVNALLRGEVDVIDYVAPQDVQRLRNTAGLAVQSIPVGSPLAVRLYANVPDSPLAKRDVRLALNYAIDTQQIIKSVLLGIGAPLASYISASYPYGVDPSIKPYGYDPARARKLLAAAGYPHGFKTQLWCSNDNPKEICEAIAAYWAAVGVTATIKTIDYTAWSRLNNTHKSGPMTIMQFTNAIYDPITPISGTASKNGTWSDYDNPQVDKLIDAVQVEADRSKRDQLFRQIARLLHDDAHAVLITELYYTFAYKSNINWHPQKGSGWYNLTDIGWK